MKQIALLTERKKNFPPPPQKKKQIGNKLLYSQIGIRNKAVLIHQSGNKVFHGQIGNKNRTIPKYQFENNKFHLQSVGTKCSCFTLERTFCSYLVKKLVLLQLIGTQKRGTVGMRGTLLLKFRKRRLNLKSVKTQAKT